MSCPEIRSRLLLAEMEELSAESEIGRHLAGCPGCATQVMNVRTGTAVAAESLNSWQSSLEPEQLLQRILVDQASARSRSEQWWGIMGTAAIVLVSLLVYLAKSERMSRIRAGLGFPDLPFVTSLEVRCLDPEAAVEIAGSILRPSRGTAQIYRNSRSVVLSGARQRVVQAELAIRMADGTLDPEHPRACSGGSSPAP